MLEEVELNEDETAWLITLGFDNPHRPSAFQAAMDPLAEAMRPTPARIYKTFKVDAKTGRVLAMKMRPV